MFFATVRFTVAKNPDKCPNLRTVGNYMSNCRKKRTSQYNLKGYGIHTYIYIYFYVFCKTCLTKKSSTGVQSPRSRQWGVQIVKVHRGCKCAVLLKNMDNFKMSHRPLPRGELRWIWWLLVSESTWLLALGSQQKHTSTHTIKLSKTGNDLIPRVPVL